MGGPYMGQYLHRKVGFGDTWVVLTWVDAYTNAVNTCYPPIQLSINSQQVPVHIYGAKCLMCLENFWRREKDPFIIYFYK